jgi:hypothetical protein
MKKDLFRKDKEETYGLLSADHVDSDNHDDIKTIMHDDDWRSVGDDDDNG